MLNSNYPELKWYFFTYRNFPSNFWNSLENQREFLDKIAENYEIKIQNEWKNINPKEIKSANGIILITSKYLDIFSMLVSVYPEIKWYELNCRNIISKEFLNFYK